MTIAFYLPFDNYYRRRWSWSWLLPIWKGDHIGGYAPVKIEGHVPLDAYVTEGEMRGDTMFPAHFFSFKEWVGEVKASIVTCGEKLFLGYLAINIPPEEGNESYNGEGLPPRGLFGHNLAEGGRGGGGN